MPKRIDPTNATLLELVYARTGSLRRTVQVAGFILAWGIARRELGRAPKMDEYAAYWKTTRRTAFREQARFREAFPELDNPGPICDVLERARAEETAVGDFGELAAIAH